MPIAPKGCSPLREVQWKMLLSALDMSHIVKLPAREPCRDCGGWLRIYRDQQFGGAWFVCRTCKFAEDGIEFASRHWKISPWAAMLRLSQTLPIVARQRTEIGFQKYIQHHCNYRHTIRLFWRQIQSQQSNSSSTIIELQRRLGFGVGQADLSTHLQRCRNFMGVTTRPALRTAVNDQYSFVGTAWDDVLVFPFYDLPDRISGFMVYGMHRKTQEVGWRFASVFHYSYGGTGRSSGMGLLPAAIKAQTAQRDGLVIMHDFEAAVRMQIRQLRDSELPLPLLACSCDQRWPQNVRDVMPHRDVVVWSPTDLPYAVRLASAVDGRVVTTPSPHAQDTLLQTVRQQPPMAGLAAMRHYAADWRHVLDQHLITSTPEACEEMFAVLRWSESRMRTYLSACGGEARRHCRRVLTNLYPPEGVKVGNGLLVSRDDQWVDARTGEVYCNAALKVEQVAVCDQTQELYYGGHVCFRGHQLPFTVSARKVVKAAAWLEMFLVSHKLGPLQGRPWVLNNAVNISKQLYSPEVVQGLGVTGWNSAQNAFVFPERILYANGECHMTPMQLWPAGSPGMGLQFGPVPVHLIEQLSALTPIAQLTWAVLVGVLQGVLAPAVHHRQKNVAIVGECNARFAEQLVTAMGCISRRIRFRETVIHPERHRWPAMVRYERQVDRDSHALMLRLPAGTLADVQPRCAAMLSLMDNWDVIDAPDILGDTTDILQDCSTLLTNYLQYLCRQHLRLPHGELEQVLFTDLEQWWTSLDGDPQAITSASTIMLTPHSEPQGADRIGRLLVRVVTGSFRVSCNLEILTAALRFANLLLSEQEFDKQPGCVVPMSWLAKHMQEQKLIPDRLSLVQA